MTTVTQGNTANFTLTESDTITVVAAGGAQGRISVTSAAGVQKMSLVFSDTRNLGPFANTDVVSITSNRGSITYTLTLYVPPSTGNGAATGTATPSALGVATAGSATAASHEDHVHALPAAGDVGAVGLPISWAAASNTPTLTSGTAVLGTAYKNTSTGVTTLGTAIDGITVLNKDDMLVCFTAGTYTLVPANNIVPPRTEGATVTLAALDNAGISATPVNCVVTVNTGLGAGFGRGFVGAGVVTFNGTATVVDHRTTGATNPACALTCIAADSYYVIGSKA